MINKPEPAATAGKASFWVQLKVLLLAVVDEEGYIHRSEIIDTLNELQGRAVLAEPSSPSTGQAGSAAVRERSVAILESLIKDSYQLARGRYKDGEFIVDEIVADTVSVAALASTLAQPANEYCALCAGTGRYVNDAHGTTEACACRQPAAPAQRDAGEKVRELANELRSEAKSMPNAHGAIISRIVKRLERILG